MINPRWRGNRAKLAVRSRNCTLAAILNLIAQEPGNEFKDQAFLIFITIKIGKITDL